MTCKTFCLTAVVLFASIALAQDGGADTAAAPTAPAEIVAQLVAMKGRGDEAIAAYRAALKSPLPDVRAAAVQLLADEAGPAAIPDVASQIQDPEFNVVVSAVHELLQIGGPQIVDPIRRALAHSNPAVRVATAGYIGDARDARFVKDLGALVSDPDTDVRAGAVAALEAIGDPAGFQFLMAASSDANLEVALTATQALAVSKDARALPRLVRLVETDNVRLREVAAYGVAALGGATDHAPLLLKLIEKEPNASVRRAVLTGLRDEPSPAAFPLLRKAAASQDVEMRRRAVLAMKVNPAPGVNDAIAALAGDSEAKVRSAVVSALGERRAESHLKLIHGMASDESPSVRAVVAAALGDFGRPDGLPVLARLVRDADVGVRGTAARAAGRIGTPGCLEILDTALQDKEPSVRLLAVEALGGLDLPAALERLRASAADPDLSVKLAAVRNLGARGDRGAVPLLKELARSDAEVLRNAARAALSDINDGAAPPASR